MNIPGKICLTFDDARYDEWLPLMPLFRKYHAHATFFFDKTIDIAALDAMKKLAAEGHSIGLHTVNHLDAVPAIPERGVDAYVQSEIRPQLDACAGAGLEIRNFAYPNNVRSEKTDALLSAKCGFRRFRAGASGYTVGVPIMQIKSGFLAPEAAAESKVLGGFGIGEYYHTTQAELDDALEYAAKTGSVIVFFSHGISEHPNPVDMKISTLENILKKAAELCLQVVSFDELS